MVYFNYKNNLNNIYTNQDLKKTMSINIKTNRPDNKNANEKEESNYSYSSKKEFEHDYSNNSSNTFKNTENTYSKYYNLFPIFEFYQDERKHECYLEIYEKKIVFTKLIKENQLYKTSSIKEYNLKSLLGIDETNTHIYKSEKNNDILVLWLRIYDKNTYDMILFIRINHNINGICNIAENIFSLDGINYNNNFYIVGKFCNVRIINSIQVNGDIYTIIYNKTRTNNNTNKNNEIKTDETTKIRIRENYDSLLYLQYIM